MLLLRLCVSISFLISPLTHGDQTNPGTIPVELKDIGIEPTLGTQVDIQNLRFFDEDGKQVSLSQYFHSPKPVLMALMYYSCPALCTFVIQGLMKSLQGLEWSVGDKFEVVIVSIDPKEKFDLAKEKRANFAKSYGRPGGEKGFHFLTGEENQIKTLASQIGFRYRYDETQQQYAHGAGIFMLTPDGKLSRVLFGIEYSPQNMKLALLEASSGGIGSILDRVVMFCYHYDPELRGYSLAAFRLIQAGAGATVFLLGGYLFVFWRRQRRLMSTRT